MSQSSDDAVFRPLPSRRSSERVAEAIHRTIVGGTFRPGDVLPPERVLAERFQVTRNTVREALRQLEQVRLVHIRQGSGVRVQDYLATAGVEFLGVLLRTAAATDEALVRDVLEARALLAGVIFAHAIDRIAAEDLASVEEAVSRFEAEAASRAPDRRLLQELEVEIHSRLIRGGNNRAFILLYNSLCHVYARVADLFEGLMADPATLAACYRRASDALVAADRAEAKRAFEEVFALGLSSSVGTPKPRQPRGGREKRR